MSVTHVAKSVDPMMIRNTPFNGSCHYYSLKQQKVVKFNINSGNQESLLHGQSLEDSTLRTCKMRQFRRER